MVWVYSVALAAGVAGWSVVGGLLPALLAVVPFLGWRRKRRFLTVAGLSAACFCYGFLSTISFQSDYQRIRSRAGRPGARAVSLKGWVCGFPQYGLGGVRFPLETTLDGRRVRLLTTAVAFGVGYGDSLCAFGTLSPGRPDRWRSLQARGACGYLRVRAGRLRSLGRGSAGSAAGRWAWRFHDSARRRLTRSLGARCALPTALAIGERGWVSRRLRSVFSKLGVSHLLALSGMHLGLIAGAVLALLRTLSVRSPLWLLLFLTVYVGVVGDVVSLYRAYAMVVVLIVAAQAQRPAKPIGTLGTALFVLLLARPALVYSVAFQLSFVATLAVLLCVTRIPFNLGAGWRRRGVAAAVSTLVVSACVQLFLLPLQLRYFGGSSLVTPVTTLAFLPAVSLLLLFDGAALAADWMRLPLAPWLYGAVGWTGAAFERSLFLAARWAPRLVEIPEPNVFLYYAGLAIVWLAPVRGKRARPMGWAVVAGRVGVGSLVCLVSFVVG
jgi:ComEC/Rec2-related protein